MAAVTLSDVASRLDRARTLWAVFAGAAAAVYGAIRPITDIDILVPAADGERVAALFPVGAVIRDEGGEVLGITLPGIDIVAGLSRHTPGLSYDIDLDDKMAARRTRHEIAGVIVPVIPPEDNVLLKAIWRRGPEQGKHDWEDVQAMLAHLSPPDWDYLHWRLDTSVSGPDRGRLLQTLKDEASALGRRPVP
jgi:hypothetical protein